jgi:hypothetical protein
MLIFAVKETCEFTKGGFCDGITKNCVNDVRKDKKGKAIPGQTLRIPGDFKTIGT